MNVYLYFVGACVALCIFFAGMAIGMVIADKQHEKEKKDEDLRDR